MKKLGSVKISVLFFILLGLILLASAIYSTKKYHPVNKVEFSILQSKEEADKKRNAEETSKLLDLAAKEALKKPYKTPPPEISAKAYAVVNLNEDKLIFAKNENLKMSPASITKIMTAIVALEEYDLNKEVVMPERCTKLSATKVGMRPNEVFTMEDMLFGLLVKSGADAACAIASITNEDDFISKMNIKAKELELKDTNFKNEIGLDSLSEDGSINEQVSSVSDILKMSKYALRSSIFRKIVGTKNIELKTLNSANKYRFDSTNDLLSSIPGTVGIKTGFTEEAKGCLSYLYENKGQEILIVILGSDDRFKDTTTLLNWAKEQIRLIKEDNKTLGG